MRKNGRRKASIFLVSGVHVALFGDDQGADEIGPEAHTGAQNEDGPQHPDNGGVNVEVLPNAAAHAGQHFIGGLRPVESLSVHTLHSNLNGCSRRLRRARPLGAGAGAPGHGAVKTI